MTIAKVAMLCLLKWKLKLPNSMKPISKYTISFFFIVAFVGFVDAAYLTLNHFVGIVPPCFITQGCDVVTTSVYSKILGIPVSLLGSLYYLFMLVLMLYYIDKEDARAFKVMALMSVIGFLFSLWFVYVQVFIINSLCSYCLVSAFTSTLLLICGIHFWRATGLHVQTRDI